MEPYEESADFGTDRKTDKKPYQEKKPKQAGIDEYKNGLFLTYMGLIKSIFSSYNFKTHKFIKWATETLFTCQLGDAECKRILAAGSLGVSAQVVKEMFKINGAETPCIYLIYIGNAKKLLGDAHGENQMLCKYGFSCDLPRRVSEHQNAFNKEFHVNIELLYFSIIDNKFISTAETRLKDYFESRKEHYKALQETYIGQFEALNDENIRLGNQIITMKNEYEINILKHCSESDRKLFEKEIECQAVISEKDAQYNKLISEKDKEIVQKEFKYRELLYKKENEYQELLKFRHNELTQKINELMQKISEHTEMLHEKSFELNEKIMK